MTTGPATPAPTVTGWLRAHGTLVLAGVLGLATVVVAATSGTGHFSGPRWVPDWSPDHSMDEPLARLSQAPPAETREASEGVAKDWPINAILLWVAVAVAVLVVAYIGWRIVSGRRSRFTRRPSGSALDPLGAVADPEPEAPVFRRGVEQALELLREDREPKDAIELAWLGLEQTAEDSGIVRKAAETPTEFTSKIMKRAFADDRAIRSLLSLYLRSRFGNHEVTAADVAQARTALEGLVATWKSPAAPARRSGLT